MSPDIELSVIIVSWNVRRDLEVCLQSLHDNSEASHEVIVVDNASLDDTLAMLQQRPEVRVIANEDNRGFAAANNQGLAVARGAWLLLLNPDTVVPPGALRELLDFAHAHPEAGVIGPRLLNPDGSLQYSCRSFPTITAGMFRHTFLGRLFPRVRSMRDYLMCDWAHDTVREVDWLSGAAMLIRREAFEQIGGLDERFYWGSEDVDYCYRMHQAGWQVVYTPTPSITHAIGRSTDQVQLATIIRTHRSMQRLFAKHLARNALQRALISAGIWVRAGLLLASFWLRRHWTRRRRRPAP
ncbi:MAG: glycosyltransferase family 2 protein [Armatimonadetes bacterium]|nr:glycosyltransferase family 2 protein [Armatimonadota bacterium]